MPVKALFALNSIDSLKPLRYGTEINLPPKEKFQLDRDDRYDNRKASYKKSRSIKTKKSKNKKMLVTALNKKKTVVND